ncbi:MAG: hypothetical protein WD768_17900 [Phycisphaeraceae bacterium]
MHAIHFTVALLLLCVPVQAEDFEIKLDRPWQVGQRFRVTKEQTNEIIMTMHVNGKAKEPNAKPKLSRRMKAEVEVLEVNKNGHLVSVRFRVEELSKAIGDHENQHGLLKNGTWVVETMSKDGPRFTLEDTDAELPPAATDVLKQLNLTHRVSDQDGVDLWSLTGRRYKIGDTWELDGDKAAKAWKAGDGKVSGQMKLTAMKEYAGLPCLEMSSEVNAIGIPVSADIKAILPDSEIKSAVLKGTLSALVPKDTTQLIPMASRSKESTFVFKVTPPEDVKAELALHLQLRETSRQVYEHVK